MVLLFRSVASVQVTTIIIFFRLVVCLLVHLPPITTTKLHTNKQQKTTEVVGANTIEGRETPQRSPHKINKNTELLPFNRRAAFISTASV